MRTGGATARLRVRSGEELLVMTILGTRERRHEVRRELDRRSHADQMARVGSTGGARKV